MLNQDDEEGIVKSVITPVVLGLIFAIGTWTLWVSTSVYRANEFLSAFGALSEKVEENARIVQAMDTRISVMQAQTSARDTAILTTLNSIALQLERGTDRSAPAAVPSGSNGGH